MNVENCHVVRMPMWCDASSRSTIAVNRSSEVSSWAMLSVGRCSSRGNDEVYVSTKLLQCWSSVLRSVWKCIIMVAKVENKEEKLLFYIKIYYLCPQFCSGCPVCGLRMKRESGESPEQSRCCVPLCCTSNLLPLMLCLG